MGIGLEGAYGNSAMAAEVRARIVAQIQAQQQQAEMALKMRAADRADRALDQNDAFRRDNLDRENARDAATAADRADTNNRALGEQIPAGSFLEPESPIVGRLQSIGALQPQEERPKVLDGPLLPGDSGGEKKRGYLKMASEKQTVDAQTAADKKADNERQSARDAQTERYQTESLRIQGQNAAASGQSRELQAQLTALKLQGEQDKLDRARTDRTRNDDNARQSTQTALGLVDRLLGSEDGTVKEHPGMNAANGAYEMRGFTQGAQDFNAIRNQLVATLTLPNLGSLKGPMSDKDIVFVKQLATRLGNPKLSEDETRLALREARVFLKSKSDGAPTAPSGNGGKSDPLGIR